MKNFLLVLSLILTTVSVNAQSKKVIREQLLSKLEVTKTQYDSLAKVYISRFNELEKLRKDLRVKQLRNLDMQKKDIKSKMEIVSRKHANLMSLGFDANTLVPIEPLKAQELPNYQSEIDAVNKAFTDVFYFQKVEDTMHLKDLKVKVQNDCLTRMLAIYTSAFSANVAQLNKASGYISELKSLGITLDSMSGTYGKLHLQLADSDKILQKKLDELKENYRLKGPKGFSKAYSDQFPEVFRPVEDHLTIDNAELPNWGGVSVQRDPAPVQAETPEIYDVVDEVAEFPGGTEALNKYIMKNLIYPQSAREMELSGKCYLKFIVSTSGNISNVKVLKGVPDCPECDREAMRVVKGMPNWTPGKIKGEAVNSFFTIPVKFALD